MAKNAPLFGKLLKDDAGLQAELAKTAVAADLAVLVARAGVSRTELAKRLGWSKARVSQVLSGNGNLTVETIHAVTRALGHRFDVVFRAAHEARAPQLWERSARLELSGKNVFDLAAFSSMRGPGARRSHVAWAKTVPMVRQSLMELPSKLEALDAA
jgi:transcriptional regulator with XRE-family HTH domain